MNESTMINLQTVSRCSKQLLDIQTIFLCQQIRGIKILLSPEKQTYKPCFFQNLGGNYYSQHSQLFEHWHGLLFNPDQSEQKSKCSISVRNCFYRCSSTDHLNLTVWSLFAKIWNTLIIGVGDGEEENDHIDWQGYMECKIYPPPPQGKWAPGKKKIKNGFWEGKKGRKRQAKRKNGIKITIFVKILKKYSKKFEEKNNWSRGRWRGEGWNDLK